MTFVELIADPMRIAVAAEYASPEELIEGVRQLRQQGYQRLDTYTPYPLEEISALLHLRRTRLPVAVFIGGLLGAITGYGIQYFCNTLDYPLNVGGRPLHPVLSYVPITFETLVLFASFTAFVGLFVLCRLPETWNPLFEVDGFEHASVDRFWLGVDERDARYEPRRTAIELINTGPLRVVSPLRL